jgi:Zn-dependent protease with chaperone function
LDFFAQQERSRAASRRFLLWYLAAALGVIGSYCLAAALIYAFFATAGALPVSGGELVWHGLWTTYFAALFRVPPHFLAFIAAIVGLPMLVVTAARLWQLREGGPAIAELLGARYVESGRCSPDERRVLNIVEEMAVASGIAVPPVYLLAYERGINAMVAGYSPNEAVIIITRGAVESLTRDELQGVVAHEFSHILNGDMALNMFLAGWLAGLTWVSTKGEQMALASLGTRDTEGNPAGEPLSVLFGTFLAFVGFPGSLAADAIRARISREREMLADAASVQLTRNPEGIAGALDSLLSLPAYTTVSAAYSREFAHMFFAPAVSRWCGFATHPPIAERIRRADPRFRPDDYRARRYGRSRDVAVLDDLGNVVKHVASLPREAVGRPTAQHVDFAARLLSRLPRALCDALREPHGAELAMFALGFEREQREASLALVERLRGADCARATADLHTMVAALKRQHMLTLAGLAIPAIKSQPQKERERFLADLARLVELDGRVTLREFVLFTLLRQRLREGAGLPIPARFRSIAELSTDAQAVLSLVALCAGPAGVRQAFERAAAVLELGWREALPASALGTQTLGAALDRLRELAPFAKPAFLKACCEAAGADGKLTLQEAELVRMVAATLDCPVPPLVGEQDPLALAA